MVQRGHRSRLLLKATQAVGFAGKGFGKNLQRDIAPEARIACAIDFAHAASTERREDLVRSEFCAGGKGHVSAPLYMPRE